MQLSCFQFSLRTLLVWTFAAALFFSSITIFLARFDGSQRWELNRFDCGKRREIVLWLDLLGNLEGNIEAEVIVNGNPVTSRFHRLYPLLQSLPWNFGQVASTPWRSVAIFHLPTNQVHVVYDFQKRESVELNDTVKLKFTRAD